MSDKFRMIACATRKLYALDEDGQVWTYVPALKASETTGSGPEPHFAFWTRLTNHRAGGGGET